MIATAGSSTAMTAQEPDQDRRARCSLDMNAEQLRQHQHRHHLHTSADGRYLEQGAAPDHRCENDCLRGPKVGPGHARRQHRTEAESNQSPVDDAEKQAKREAAALAQAVPVPLRRGRACQPGGLTVQPTDLPNGGATGLAAAPQAARTACRSNPATRSARPAARRSSSPRLERAVSTMWEPGKRNRPVKRPASVPAPGPTRRAGSAYRKSAQAPRSPTGLRSMSAPCGR